MRKCRVKEGARMIVVNYRAMPPGRYAAQPPEDASRTLTPVSTKERPKKTENIFIADSHLSNISLARSNWTNQNRMKKLAFISNFMPRLTRNGTERLVAFG